MTTLLDSQRKSIRREACWILSNVCAGPCSQVSQVISQVGILPRLLSMFQHDANDVKREICYVFSNMAHMGNP